MTRRLKKASLLVAILLTISVAVPGLFCGPDPKPTGPGDKTSLDDKKAGTDDNLTGDDVSIKGGGLPPGCTCHSKNPGLVSMHNLFSVEDCQKCHGKDEDLMGAEGQAMTDERKAALEERMRKEPICTECHS